MSDPFNGGSSATMFVPVGRDADREARRAEVVRRRARVNTAGIALRLNASGEDLREVLESLGLIEWQVPLKPTLSLVQPEPSPGAPNGPDGGSASNSGPGGRFQPPPRQDPTLCPKQLHPWIPENQIRRVDGRGVSCRPCHNATRRARKAQLRLAKPPKPVKVKPPKPEPGPRMCKSGEHELIPGGGWCVPCRNKRDRASRAARRPETRLGPDRVKEKRRQASIDKARAVLAGIPVEETPAFDEFGVEVKRCPARLHRMVGDNVSTGQKRRCKSCRHIVWAKATLQALVGEELA